MSSAAVKPLLITDYRTSDYELNRLDQLGCRIIAAERRSELYEAVDGHPDLQFASIDNTLICHRGISEKKYREIFRHTQNVIRGKSSLKLPYPHHISLNAVITEDLFLHKLENTDSVLMDIVEKSNRVLLRTPQGYTRCSCAYVGNNAYVTEDKGIAELLISLGRKVFYRRHANVYLEGFDYGFIGGALSLIKDKSSALLLISGDLPKYEFGHDLKCFLKEENIAYECIGKGQIMDRGSIIEIP